MHKRLVIAILIVIFLHLTANAQSYSFERDERFLISGGMTFGYEGGPGGQMNTTISNFIINLPISARFAVKYAKVEPGNAADAREIFINDATNGVPSEKGHRWNIGFDILTPISLANTRATYVFVGPRYAMHTSNFKYIGGNEDFDVTSNHWGVGGGLETHFGISPRFDLVLGGGLDHYFSSTLYGHDTAYGPNGEYVNQRKEFEYEDADKAIGQPKNIVRLMMGMHYYFR
jgi:hypothetical protein